MRTSLTLLLFLAVAGASCHASHWRTIRTLTLSRDGGARSTITVKMDVYSTTRGVTEGEIYVVFTTRPPAVGKRVVEDLGPAFLNTVHYDAHDYVGLGRQELFITFNMGRTCTYILDYNGKTTRTIYQLTGGRVGVTPIRAGKHRWSLEEVYSKYAWGDNDDMGRGGVIDKDGDVARIMVWRGGKFVLQYPGDTSPPPYRAQ